MAPAASSGVRKELFRISSISESEGKTNAEPTERLGVAVGPRCPVSTRAHVADSFRNRFLRFMGQIRSRCAVNKLKSINKMAHDTVSYSLATPAIVSKSRARD